MKIFLMLMFVLSAVSIKAQEILPGPDALNKISIGVKAGLGFSYTDKAFLLNVPASISIDYKLSKKYYLQFAPNYIWLIRWNEHYLSLPIHLGLRANNKWSFFAGPALTFDIGNFKDWGISAGIHYHVGTRSSIILSGTTFSLYDYKIDFLFVPVGITFNYMIL
jgi:hypothetical protein